MKKGEEIGLDFEIDKLTNSIENVITGDSFATDISLLTRSDLTSVAKTKAKRLELDIDIIGGEGSLTLVEEKALSDFFKQRKLVNLIKHKKIKRSRKPKVGKGSLVTA